MIELTMNSLGVVLIGLGGTLLVVAYYLNKTINNQSKTINNLNKQITKKDEQISKLKHDLEYAYTN